MVKGCVRLICFLVSIWQTSYCHNIDIDNIVIDNIDIVNIDIDNINKLK